MKLKVLIIDDEECVRDSFSMYLEGRGHEVLTACNPLCCDVTKGCPCRKEQACADVILIDQNMPGLKGTEFLRMQIQRGCQAPVANKVIMSGNVSTELRREAEALGCRVIQKPFNFEMLDDFLREVSRRLSGDA